MSSPVRNQSLLRTSNPTMRPELYQEAARTFTGDKTMTINGTINCTGILLCLVLMTAAYTWRMYDPMDPGSVAAVMPWMMGGMIGGLVLALVTMFKQTWAPFTAPAYALAEGLFLGGISAVVQAQFPDQQIVLQAVGLTFGVLFVMLAVYRTGIIKVTDKFRMGVVAATGGVMLLYLATWILGMFGVGIPYIHGSGVVGIGFSLFVVGLASLNLVLDFDLIETGARAGAPKYMEWFGAFALMVTLIWLYIEILRLLAKLNSRR
ncbi:MAG: membrane protein [Phycisphaerae bacterium]|nr:MAG: membrane protein [Phycisphaerae bacterium]